MASEKLRVAVIGAGAAGLCAARHLLASPDMFAPPVVFEASDHLGGTWVYTEESGEDAEGQPIHSSMYHDLRTNLPKEVMAFPDFPFDPSLPSFLHHSDVLTYLESYAEHSGIQDHVQFQWQVDKVRPGWRGTGSPSGWDVTAKLRGPKSAQHVTEHFDAVMVCTGHYARPFSPSIPGLDSFQGHLLHSHNYRHPEPFAGLSVVLVGAGASGVDLALQLLPVATRVVLSHQGVPVRGLPEEVVQVPPLLKVSSRLRGCCSHLVLQLLQEVQLTLGSSVGGWGTKPELPGRQEQAASKRENGWLSNCPESIAEWLIGNIQSN